MLLDARRADHGAELECDVCVVGGGAAGITVARELSATSLDVCLLESGGTKLERETQDLYLGENVGHPYGLAGSRLRYLGGTTNHWRGWCRPLDEIDFQERDGVPHTGWPLTRAQLDPYYARAHEVCELGRLTYDVDEWARITDTRPLRPTDDVESTIFQVSPPTRFGKTYREDLERSRSVRVVLHANVVGLELDRAHGAVRRARAATLTGRKFDVAARQFVLAAGAIENARLLLASNEAQPRGIGNDHDLVGRFFADHAHIVVGAVLLSARRRSSAFYGLHPKQGKPKAEGLLAITDRMVRTERLVRSCASLVPSPVDPPLGAEVRAVAREMTGGDMGVTRVLDLRSEQAPNPNSRVTLADAVDRLGVPKVRLDWQFTELDRRSRERSVAAIAGALGAAGLGRVHNPALADPRFWSKLHGGAHHIGTARMHRDPRHGVVDANCRVHGTANLYVAGSAVFPTTGYANPTLTIVALAIRLATHLKRVS